MLETVSRKQIRIFLIAAFLALFIVSYFSLQHGLTSKTGATQAISALSTRETFSVKKVQEWLASLPAEEQERALNGISRGFLKNRLHMKGSVKKPFRPKIMLNWRGENNGGWWPWDSPQTMKELNNIQCRAQCDWIDTSASEEEISSSHAILFHGPFTGKGDPRAFRNKYGKPAYQSYWMFTQESNENYPVQKDPEALALMDHTMNYELDSEVPITYGHRLWLMSFYQLHPKRDDADAFFMSSNCSPKNKRLIYVREIMKHIRVHSYGSCENNVKWEGDKGQDSRAKLALQGSYKFCLCFDNTDQKDYISEKFFHALASGCLPVYMGTPTIDEYLPVPEAAVKVTDFESAEAVGKYLKYLLDHPEEYNKRLAWKGGGVDGKGVKQGVEKLRRLQYLSFLSGPCRLCEFLAGKESERTPDEQWTTYKALARHAVKNKFWQESHDKDGLTGLKRSEQDPEKVQQLHIFLDDDDDDDDDEEEPGSSVSITIHDNKKDNDDDEKKEKEEQHQQQQQQVEEEKPKKEETEEKKHDDQDHPSSDDESKPKKKKNKKKKKSDDSQEGENNDNDSAIMFAHGIGPVIAPAERPKPVDKGIKIAMYWDEPRDSGWWPWGHPETLENMLTGCRATCDFVNPSDGKDALMQSKVVLFHGPHLGRGWGTLRYMQEVGKQKDQVLWLFTHESHGNYPNQIEGPDAMLFDDHMSYELANPVPVTYAHRVWMMSFYQLFPKRDDADAFFMSSNCAPRNQRLIWIREIMKHIRVHSYGGCENNIKWTHDRGQDSRAKIALQGSYKFCLCFDNTDQTDYISEKFFHALASGCLPVYMGTPTIDKYIPVPEAVIKTSDFSSPEELSRYLRYLLDNPEEYNKRLAWKGGGHLAEGKKQGVDKMLELKYLSFATGPCRLCEKLSGVSSERTREEKMQLYLDSVHAMVKMQPWSLYHDRDGPDDIDFTVGVV